jgi:hypothetical protein
MNTKRWIAGVAVLALAGTGSVLLGGPAYAQTDPADTPTQESPAHRHREHGEDHDRRAHDGAGHRRHQHGEDHERRAHDGAHHSAGHPARR